MRLFNESVSDFASNILTNNFNTENILFVMEDIDIDGCDKYGITSRTYNLFIISNKDTDYVLYEYYREDWHGDKSEKYVLSKKTIIDFLKPYFIEILHENIKYIDDIKLIEKIKNLNKIIDSLKN